MNMLLAFFLTFSGDLASFERDLGKQVQPGPVCEVIKKGSSKKAVERIWGQPLTMYGGGSVEASYVIATYCNYKIEVFYDTNDVVISYRYRE